jgi:hypothetical protein
MPASLLDRLAVECEKFMPQSREPYMPQVDFREQASSSLMMMLSPGGQTVVSFEEWLRSPDGGDITAYKDLGDGLYAATKRLIYHWTMIVGQIGDYSGYEDRFCYATRAGAEAALLGWDGSGEPEGWHRHPNTGRRREGGDPGKETIAW